MCQRRRPVIFSTSACREPNPLACDLADGRNFDSLPTANISALLQCPISFAFRVVCRNITANWVLGGLVSSILTFVSRCCSLQLEHYFSSAIDSPRLVPWDVNVYFDGCQVSSASPGRPQRPTWPSARPIGTRATSTKIMSSTKDDNTKRRSDLPVRHLALLHRPLTR